MSVALATDPATLTAPKQHTEPFDCPECGHRFRRRTKAGIWSRCPRCAGIALGATVRDRQLAAARARVDISEEAGRKRSAGRAREKAARELDAPLPSDGPPAPDVDGGNSAHTEAEARGLVAARGVAEQPQQPPRRRPSPTLEPIRRPAPPVNGRSAPPVAPPPAPRRPGLFGRVFGTPDDGDMD